MMDCQHASHLISQSLDHRLSWGQRFSLRLHLLMCDACTRFALQLKLLRQAVGGLVSRTVNDETLTLSDEARRRIGQAIQHPDQFS